MNSCVKLAYRIDPALWVREVLGVEPWPGNSIPSCAARRLDHRTDGTAGRQDHDSSLGNCAPHAVHARKFERIACPVQRQSAEAVRRVHDILISVGATLTTDNVYALELKNGSRVLALPGSDDSIRGLTVDGWIVADEAARLSPDLIAALGPMRARRPQARFAMLSTAWSRTDPFWTIWETNDPSWTRLKATAEDVDFFSEQFLQEQLRLLGEHSFRREYFGIPLGAEASPFQWELYDRATRIQAPMVAPGRAFGPSAA